MKRTNWRQFLLKQAERQHNNLTLLLAGASLFFVGIGSIYYAEHALRASFQQEILALAGIGLMLLGGLLAAAGYIGLSVLRLYKFITDKDDHD